MSSAVSVLCLSTCKMLQAIHVFMYVYPPLPARKCNLMLIVSFMIFGDKQQSFNALFLIKVGCKEEWDSNSRTLKCLDFVSLQSFHHYIDPSGTFFTSWIVWSLVNIGYVWQSNQFTFGLLPREFYILASWLCSLRNTDVEILHTNYEAEL